MEQHIANTREEFLKEILSSLSSPVHTRLVEAYAHGSLLAMEDELKTILAEVAQRED